ncbi:MAG: DUF4249 domain-containing protein [Bacteroidota bacterium]
MKTYKLYISTVIIALGLFSCDVETTVELGAPEQKLVVEGRIEYNEADPVLEQTITLSVLGDFFENATTPRATGAQVSVTDGDGNRFDFLETGEGVYQNTSLVGEIGQRYTLQIDWNGEQFEAIETLTAVAPIDSIYQVFEEGNVFEDEGIKIAIDFTDPSGTEDFYFWETYLENELQILPDPGNKNNLIGSDEFFDGNKIEGYFPNEEAVFAVGASVSVKQLGVSENAYNYYFTLYDQAGKIGALIDTPPIPVRGNIRNLTNPDNFPLGYFYASQVDEKAYVVE